MKKNSQIPNKILYAEEVFMKKRTLKYLFLVIQKYKQHQILLLKRVGRSTY